MIPAASSLATVLGDGVTTTFNYSFYIPAIANLVLIYTDGSGNQTTLDPSFYTATVNNPNGGTVTYPLTGMPIAPGTSLTISRVLPLAQLSSFSNQGDMYPMTIESQFDKCIMIAQQLNAQINLLAQEIDAGGGSGGGGGGGSGNVSGPGYSVPNNLVLFNNNFGTSIKDSGVALSALALTSSLATMAYQSATAVNITGGTITGMPTPTSTTAVATKGYVDSAVAGGGGGAGAALLAASAQTFTGINTFTNYTAYENTGAIRLRYNSSNNCMEFSNGSTITRRIPMRSLSEATNVNEYGADGSGATDSTTAFQNAINFCVTTGRALYIPHGNYMISSPLTATINTSNTSLTIIGDGYGISNIIWNGTNQSTNYLLNIVRTDSSQDGTYYVTLRDFAIISNANTGYIGGLKMSRAVYMNMENILIKGMAHGWLLDQVISSSFTNVKCINNVYGCLVYGSTSSPIGGSPFEANANTFNGCLFGGNGYWGFYCMDGCFSMTGGSIEGNGQTGGTNGYGAYVGWSSNVAIGGTVSFDSVYFEGNGTSGDPGTNQSKADLYLSLANTGERQLVDIRGCNFDRLQSLYAPYGIVIDNVSSASAGVTLQMNNFNSYNGYTPSANRPMVKVFSTGAQPRIYNKLNNWGPNAIEYPDFVAFTTYYPGMAPISGSLVWAYANQTIASSSATAVNFANSGTPATGLAYNNFGIYSSATPTQLIVPAGASVVRLSGNVRYASTTNGGLFELFVRKNGVATNYPGEGRQSSQYTGGSSYLANLNVSTAEITVSPGDYFELFTQQTTGSSLGLDNSAGGAPATWFTMEIVG